jgi:formylglycine-generating enzyme required for sulfatase activity
VVQLNLEDVYVPLEAEAFRHWEEKEKMPRKEEREPASYSIELDQVLQQGNHVVITGGPGCGKTTVLIHIAWALSNALAEDNPALAREKLSIAGDLSLPIFVPLSAYAMYRRNLSSDVDPRKKTLAAYISHFLIEKQFSFNLPDNFFERLLIDGRAVILLLDGLDEVPDEDERALVRQAIEEMVDGREGMQVVVTCRSAAHRGRSALGKDFREIRVKPLDPGHTEKVIRQAYRHLYRHDEQECQRKSDELLNSIKLLEEQRRQRLGKDSDPLVTSPLLVRMLLVVHFSERRLPEQRAELYMKATDAMLLPEYAPDEEVASQIGRLVGSSKEQHRELVQHLAFEMHRKGPEQGREITEDDLRKILSEDPAHAAHVKDFIQLTRLRGTLLEERLGIYRFIHLSFQEFLAARYLAEVKRGESGIAGVVDYLVNGLVSDSWWREPILLTAGYLSVTSPRNAQMFLKELSGVENEQKNRRLSPAVQIIAAELAASAFLEWLPENPLLQRALAGRIVQLYADQTIMATAPPELRAAAGNALARLGDSRPEVTAVDDMQFCYVPGGPFYMGSPDADKDAYNEEKPLHENKTLTEAFWISRYPVTVAQFREFVKSTNFEPGNKKSLEGLLNYPVVYVSWHEALQFCDWLTEKWSKEGKLSPKWKITLPSEAQWEKAARGGIKIPASPIIESIETVGSGRASPDQIDNPDSRRRYPWGNDPDPNCANYADSKIGTPSAVGCFSGGVSVYGCEEMSGNVFEWCLTKWRNNYKEKADETLDRESSRVFRGGAFYDDHLSVRCASRDYFSPDNRYYDVGFRVVLSP